MASQIGHAAHQSSSSSSMPGGGSSSTGGGVRRHGAGLASRDLPVSLNLAHVAPATHMLEKRKQLLQVQQQLEQQKDSYARQEELFTRRAANLRKKDLELQEALVLFNRYLKENEHKRRKADHRAADERTKTKKWGRKLEAWRQHLSELKARCRQLKKDLVAKERYTAYLQLVQEENGDVFQSLDAIITRHRMLDGAQRDLLVKAQRFQHENELLRQKFQAYKKDQYNLSLSLNNDIASESKALEDEAERASDVQQQIFAAEAKATARALETTQLTMAVDNVYSRCKRHEAGATIKHTVTHKLSDKERADMPSRAIKHHNCIERLDVIARYLVDFESIWSSISHQNAKDFRGGKGGPGSSSWGNRFMAAAASSSSSPAGKDAAGYGGGGGGGASNYGYGSQTSRSALGGSSQTSSQTLMSASAGGGSYSGAAGGSGSLRTVRGSRSRRLNN